MKLPRDLSGRELAKILVRFGYHITRETGSHLRVTTKENGGHHLTIPDHSDLRVGTLAAILREVERHFELDRSEVIQRLFP